MPETFPDQTLNYRAAFDAIPLIIFLVNENLRVTFANRTANELLGKEPESLLALRCGDILHCIHALSSEEGCGTSDYCRDCAVRNAVLSALDGRETAKEQCQVLMQVEGALREAFISVTASPCPVGPGRTVLLILEDLTELTLLSRIIPICASCSKIRNDEDQWERPQHFLSRTKQVRFEPLICPDCMNNARPATARRSKPPAGKNSFRLGQVITANFQEDVCGIYDLLASEGMARNEAIKKTRAILKSMNYQFVTYDLVMLQLRAAGRFRKPSPNPEQP